MSAEQKACVMKATDVPAMDSCFGDSGYNPLTGSEWQNLKPGVDRSTGPGIDKVERGVGAAYGRDAQ